MGIRPTVGLGIQWAADAEAGSVHDMGVNLEDVLVKEDEGVEGLVLRRGGDIAIHREMGGRASAGQWLDIR